MTTRRTFAVAFFAGLLAASLFRWFAPPELVKVYAEPLPVGPREVTVRRVIPACIDESLPFRPAPHEIGMVEENERLRQLVLNRGQEIVELRARLANRERTIVALVENHRAFTRLNIAVMKYRTMVKEWQIREAEPWLKDDTRFKLNDWPLGGEERSNRSGNSTKSEENGIVRFFNLN